MQTTRFQETASTKVCSSQGGRAVFCSFSTTQPCVNRLIPLVQYLGGVSYHKRESVTRCKVASLEQNAATAKDALEFDWSHQWYPLAILKDLDPRLPHPLQLLGKDLVLWQDKEGNWNVFEDRCPHRLAPLSEGRIHPEDGTLQCSYHGWRFNNNGSCVAIPQAASQEAEAVAAASSRACAAVHPVKMDLGILWVWGDSSAIAQVDAAAKPLPLPEFPSKTGELSFSLSIFMRDMPMDYETLVENLLDSAHPPFSHHGVIGDRDAVKYGDYSNMPEPNDAPNKIQGKVDKGTLASFTAPSNLQYSHPMKKEKDFWFITNFYVVPIRPGQSRLITFGQTNSSDELPLSKRLRNMLPEWYLHSVFRNEVFDGDNYMLHAVERRLATEYMSTGKGWRKLYYTPTASDSYITAFRQWLDKSGGGGPWGPGKYMKLPPVHLGRKETLDRYNQHTKHCKACAQALESIRRLDAIAGLVVIVCCAAGLMAALSQGIGALVAPQWLACGVGAALAAAARPMLQKHERKLVFEDYVHGLK